jgi:hypothetical protein
MLYCCSSCFLFGEFFPFFLRSGSWASRDRSSLLFSLGADRYEEEAKEIN